MNRINRGPITSISFSISGKNIRECYNILSYRGFTYIDGDLRTGAGRKYAALGYKREEGKDPITNILGYLSDDDTPQTITEDGLEYEKITDEKGNGDIHKGSGGSDLYLYYTRDRRKKPIKDLIFTTILHKKRDENEVVQHCHKSKRSGNLNINAERSSSKFNYIVISRE